MGRIMCVIVVLKFVEIVEFYNPRNGVNSGNTINPIFSSAWFHIFSIYLSDAYKRRLKPAATTGNHGEPLLILVQHFL